MQQSNVQRRDSVSSIVAGAAVILSVAGCAQPGTSTGLTGPSTLSIGASSSLSPSDAIRPSQAPGANYDATGSWFAVLTFKNPQDKKVHGEGILNIVQDGSGNLTGSGEDDPGTYAFALMHAGGGAISYQLSITSPDPDGPGPQCARNISGLAHLHPAMNTIQAHRLLGTAETETGCQAVEFSMALTKQ